MSNKVTVAAIQMTYGLEEACEKVREAASQGAQIILLPELFENWYFCQEKSYENYHLATTLEENPAVREMQTIARDFKVVIPVSYYERVGETTFNTVAVIDADGTIMGQYRKTHIPDDHFYQEKFYFTPGNTGFKVWDTAYAKIGVGICWDQWFPESSLTFYGSSFIADETGALVEQADRENAGVLTHTFDLDEIREMRRSWGVYRDRRPEMYGAMRGYGAE